MLPLWSTPFRTRQAGIKPRVLVVDDHPEMLRGVAAFLATDFDVVALARDGSEALDLAPRVAPDVIVLDVAMPGLDGLEVAQRLQELGSPARIVFLTSHDGEDHVAAAFRVGGRAFVTKPRLASDLARALEHVLEGRFFLPSLTSLLAVPRAGGHAVQFHDYDHSFIDGVGDFLNRALQRGDAVAVVATASVRAGIAERLRIHEWNVGESGEHGRYRAIDAAESLAHIMRDGRPDAERLAESVAQLDQIRIATAEGPLPRLILVGEIAVPLFLDGNGRAAMEIERLWNALTGQLPWLGVCCYPMTCFADVTDPERFQQVCAQHGSVSHAPWGRFA